jgi:uncharacterized protein YjaZ
MVSAYLGMGAYAAAAQASPGAALEELWHRHAIRPYWDAWAAGQWNEKRLREKYQHPFPNVEALSQQVQLLHASGVERLIENAYEQIAAALPPYVDNPVICIYALDPDNTFAREQMGGVVGSGVGDNSLLEINPLTPGWQDWVPYVLAHEHHHSVWGYHYFHLQGHQSADLLTGLLIDGQADSFARRLYPNIEPPWIHALEPGQETRLWKRLTPWLDNPDQDLLAKIMFGDEELELPQWAGYTLGYRIIQAYLRSHPGGNPADLLEKDAHDILTESGYKA